MAEEQLILQNLYNQVEKQIQTSVDTKAFDTSDLVPLLKAVIETIDSFSSKATTPLTGEQKVDYASKLISYILNDLNQKKILNDDLKIKLDLSLEILTPIICELVVLADKGGLSLIHLTKPDCCAKCTIC